MAEQPQQDVSKLSLAKTLLLYPTLLLSLAGSVPTAWQALKAWRLDVNYNKVQIAEAQQKLWQVNAACLESKAVYSVELPSVGVQVGVTICPSGDALLRYQPSAGQATYTWLAFPGTMQKRAAFQETLKAGQEQPPALVQTTLLYGATRCTVARAGMILRLFTPDGAQCRVEMIDRATGVLVSGVPVACNVPCAGL